MEDKRGRDMNRSKKPRETFIGVDSTGIEYWLVPFADAKVGNRKFEMRKCAPQKQLPAMLDGMVTDAASGERLFEKWKANAAAKKKAPAKKASNTEA